MKKKIIIISIAAVVLLAAAILTWHVSRPTKSTPGTATTTAAKNSPTPEEQASGNTIKQNIVDKNTTPTTTTSTANVVITNASETNKVIDINAYTTHYEDGTCTFTFSKSGQTTFTKQTDASRDASTTICNNPLVAASSFATSGTWTVIVTYSNASNTVSGTSASTIINITT